MAELPVEKRILFEDNHLLIVNKIPGELVQPDTERSISLEDTLKEYLRSNNGKPGNIYLGVIHRIDRPVSGVVIFAKSSKALSRLNRMLQEKKIQKTYWAIVDTKPDKESATLVNYLIRNTRNNTVKVYDREVKDSLRSEMQYTFLSGSDRYFLLSVNLVTGRHHQIRAQLAHAGMHIKGDLKYGAARSNPDGSISLHARNIRFTHPVTLNEMCITAPVIDDRLWKYFESTQSLNT